jgi:mannose-6-phosphate isomerase-like protein (cupin superfamily)
MPARVHGSRPRASAPAGLGLDARTRAATLDATRECHAPLGIHAWQLSATLPRPTDLPFNLPVLHFGFETAQPREEATRSTEHQVRTVRTEPEMLHPIDTNRIRDSHPEGWHAETLASIDGVNLKFRVMRNSIANFHKHEDTPECFLVLSGKVQIDTENGSITLEPGQFYKVEPGVSHRSKVDGEATLIVFDRIAA